MLPRGGDGGCCPLVVEVFSGGSSCSVLDMLNVFERVSFSRFFLFVGFTLDEIGSGEDAFLFELRDTWDLVNPASVCTYKKIN